MPRGLEAAVLTAVGVAALRICVPRTAATIGDGLAQLEALLTCRGCGR